MADTVSFIQTGSTTMALNSGDFEVKEINISVPAPEFLVHIPDYGENRVVRVEDGDREATIRMRIVGSDWDDVHNNIAIVRRWLKEAARAETDGDTNTVYLQVKRGSTGSTATHATNHQIRYGWMDGDSSVFSPFGENSEQAIVVFLHLLLTPYGERATTIALNNYMFSSPHAVEDSNADGLADGWTETGTPTTTILTTRSVTGGQCQQVTTDNNSTEGIVCDEVLVVQNEDIVAYAWIRGGTGMDPITIQLTDGADTDIDNVEFDMDSPTGYDKSTTGDYGYTWYRYVVSGPNAGAANCKLYIQRTIANSSIITTFHVDACYIDIDATAAPDAFSSAMNLDNRCDPTSTSQATENYINYLDVALIPGDAPAKMLLKNTFSTADIAYYQLWGLEQDGKNVAATVPFVIESDDLTLHTGIGVYDETQGAGAYHGVNRARYTAGVETDAVLTYNFSAADSAILAGRVFKVLVGCWADDADNTIALDIGDFDGSVQSVTAGITTASTWELKTIGLIMPSPLQDSEAGQAALTVFLNIGGLSNGDIFEVDAVFLMPVDKGAVVANMYANHTSLYLDGPRNSVYTNVGASDYIGRTFELAPGSITNRLRVLNYNRTTADGWILTNQFPITLTITPRTRHLIGTF